MNKPCPKEAMQILGQHCRINRDTELVAEDNLDKLLDEMGYRKDEEERKAMEEVMGAVLGRQMSYIAGLLQKMKVPYNMLLVEFVDAAVAATLEKMVAAALEKVANKEVSPRVGSVIVNTGDVIH